jgi:protein-S-isoprenylcysteine O-methyltransferase Ste14
LFRHRNLIFPITLVALLGGFRPVYPLDSETLDRWLDALGLAVALAGQSLRAAVIGYAYIQRGGRHGRVYAAKLVTGGFFNHSRNPLYVGNLMILLGLFTIHGNPWAWALGSLFFLFAYRGIVAAEEAYLEEKFGDEYADYRRRVPRWLPDFRGLGRSLHGMEFAWRRLVIKEYGSTYAWIVGALLLLAYERLVHSGYAAARPVLAGVAVVLAIVTGGWVAARFVKKGRLAP